jgi:hypothetical protein
MNSSPYKYQPRAIPQALEPITSIPLQSDAEPRFGTLITSAGVERGFRTVTQHSLSVVEESIQPPGVGSWAAELCDCDVDRAPMWVRLAPRRLTCSRLGVVRRWRPAVTYPRRAARRRHGSRRAAVGRRAGGDPPGEPPDAKSAPHDLRPGIGALSLERLFKEHCHPKEDYREPLKEACRALNLPQPSLSSPSFDLESDGPGAVGLIRVSGPAPKGGQSFHGFGCPVGVARLRGLPPGQSPSLAGGGQ